MLDANAGFYFPYTPATNLLRGLQEALAMLDEEGLPNVFARHDRHAAATRAAVAAWGEAGAIELQCRSPADYSSSLTAVRLAEGHSADALRSLILKRFNMSLGNGLGILKDRVFRIGHLGDINDLTLIGALSGVEMGLGLAGVPTGRAAWTRRWRCWPATKGQPKRRPLERLPPPRNLKSALHRRPGKAAFEPGADVLVIAEADQFASFIKADQVAHPAEHRDIGDGEFVAHHPGPALKPRVERREHALGFVAVTMERPLVFIFAAREFVEEADLPEHRAQCRRPARKAIPSVS